MREILKKIPWVEWAILTVSLLLGFWIMSSVEVEGPSWYRQAAQMGVTFGIFGALFTLRVVGLVVYTIVKNAMATGGRIP